MHTRLQKVRGWYTRFCAYTRQKGRDPLGSTARFRSSRDHFKERPVMVIIAITLKTPQ